MRKSRVMKLACAVSLSALCAFGLAACGSSSSDSGEVDMYDTSKGVAATVNGTEIGEAIVTQYIENYRSAQGLESDADWAQWLVDNDYTPADIREDVINYYVSQELIFQAAAENDVTVSDEDLDNQVATMRAYYDTDEEWQNALATIGTTEAQYRNLLKVSMLQEDLEEKVATAEEASDEDLLTYAQMYATYYDGAKKSSHILFSSDDEATAQEVLDKINSGELDFAEAAEQYSTDDGSKDDGGNVGWDKLTQFVDEYQDALDELNEGEVSGLVTSDYGIHIIKCTEVFTAPEEITSIDQLPTEFVDSIRSMVESANKQQAYSDWYSEYKENADIQINDMPDGLSYNVSLDGVEPSDSEDDGEEVTVESDSTTTSDSTETTEDSSTTSESSDSADASSDSASTESSSGSSASSQPSESSTN